MTILLKRGVLVALRLSIDCIRIQSFDMLRLECYPGKFCPFFFIFFANFYFRLFGKGGINKNIGRREVGQKIKKGGMSEKLEFQVE